MENQKPGGGNKLQPYIPAGNGKKSGQYTNKIVINNEKHNILNCYIKNIKQKFNFLNSKLVRKVDICCTSPLGHISIPSTFTPNSVIKKMFNGYIESERYYNDKGEAYLDIDYTCHGKPNTHPVVPHIHSWKKDEFGNLQRSKWENFQWEENV